MMKYSGCFSNSSSESSAPLRRPPHFPLGISAASCSRWVNLSSQHPPIFNCTLPHMYIHKKDAIHASHRAGWRQCLQICIGPAETCKIVPLRDQSVAQVERQSKVVARPSRSFLLEHVSCLTKALSWLKFSIIINHMSWLVINHKLIAFFCPAVYVTRYLLFLIL